jgi:hypothetical protein
MGCKCSASRGKRCSDLLSERAGERLVAFMRTVVESDGRLCLTGAEDIGYVRRHMQGMCGSLVRSES